MQFQGSTRQNDDGHFSKTKEKKRFDMKKAKQM